MMSIFLLDFRKCIIHPRLPHPVILHAGEQTQDCVHTRQALYPLNRISDKHDFYFNMILSKSSDFLKKLLRLSSI